MPDRRERATWLALSPDSCMDCAGIAAWRDAHPSIDVPRRSEVRVLQNRLRAHASHLPVRKVKAA